MIVELFKTKNHIKITCCTRKPRLLPIAIAQQPNTYLLLFWFLMSEQLNATHAIFEQLRYMEAACGKTPYYHAYVLFEINFTILFVCIQLHVHIIFLRINNNNNLDRQIGIIGVCIISCTIIFFDLLITSCSSSIVGEYIMDN